MANNKPVSNSLICCERRVTVLTHTDWLLEAHLWVRGGVVRTCSTDCPATLAAVVLQKGQQKHAAMVTTHTVTAETTHLPHANDFLLPHLLDVPEKGDTAFLTGVVPAPFSRLHNTK